MGIASNANRTITIVDDLLQEWDRLCADEQTQLQVQTWSASDLRLRGAMSMRDLQDRATGPITPETDLFFRALLDYASEPGPEGDLAARVLLQLMIGRIVHTSRSMVNLISDIEERTQLATVALYEVIRTCPRDKTRYLPPHLAWTAHKRAMNLAQVGVMESPIGSFGVETMPLHNEEQLHPSEELVQVLAWSVAEGVISAGDAALLACRYGEESPGRESWVSLADSHSVADQVGISPEAMRQRCSRATRKIARVSGRYLAHQTR
ncbi:hypothetical protein [Nocardiopsis tropica]|uniref:Sigma-70 family RNA polymerase sigma factor n=1 Tax=Nocardiopsis tropica TaxID=109330 RepID=A0ABU7KMV2_9ACTN|nr:hypothetical protein [Nocardiopsis umidischolae]MEE2050623.1 hypothetical protein [Nocardiopsis umidischolae]